MDVDCKACLALEVGLDLDLVRLAVACSHRAAPSFMMIGKICNSMLICVIRRLGMKEKQKARVWRVLYLDAEWDQGKSMPGNAH